MADAEENKFYLNKIQSRSEYIRGLDKKARELQLLQDKNRILNIEDNRGKLQKYVDTQGKNIAILTDKLEKGKNTVDLNAYIYPDGTSPENPPSSGVGEVGSRQNTVNTINKLIGQSSLPIEEKKQLVNKVNSYKRMMDSNLQTHQHGDKHFYNHFTLHNLYFFWFGSIR